MKKKVLPAAIAIVSLVLFGCGSATKPGDSAQENVTEKIQNTTDTSESNEDVTVVQITYVTNTYPTAYTNENGEPDGYDIAAMKLIDDALPQYKFEYNEAQMDAAYTGLSSGKYDIVCNNSFYTPTRAENYDYPENQLGASEVGFVVRKEDADVKTLEELAANGKIGAPSFPADALTYQLDKYNEENPDNQIQFEYTDNSNAWIEAVDWVAEGRYDFCIQTTQWWDSVVTPEDGDYHKYVDVLEYIPLYPVPTYCIIQKGEDDLTEAISEQLAILKDDGTLSKLAIEYQGYDVFELTK